MADPITIEWGTFMTEVVKTGLVSASVSGLTCFFMRRDKKPAEAPQPMPQPQPLPQIIQPRSAHCSSHPYFEKDLLYMRNCMRWCMSHLNRLCQQQGITPTPEPTEEPIEHKKP